MKMKKCPNCDEILEEEMIADGICGGCGWLLEEGDAEEDEDDEDSEEDDTADEEPEDEEEE